MNKKNVGKFRLSMPLMFEKNISDVAEMFAKMKMVIVRAEMFWPQDCIKYTGICELFPEVKTGATIPEYVLEIKKVEGIIKEVKAVPLAGR